MQLIYTDVDYLIEILRTSPEKYFEYETLNRLTGIQIEKIKKWMQVLEDRGDVRIKYDFSSILVSWIGSVNKNEEEKSIHKNDSYDEEVKYILENIYQKQKNIDNLIQQKKKHVDSDVWDNKANDYITDKIKNERGKLSELVLRAKNILDEKKRN